jgi:adenosylcobyric acid synthase
MGKTTLENGAKPLLLLNSGDVGGCFSGNVYGCYLHGFFDSNDCRRSVISALCAKRGIEENSIGAVDRQEHKEKQYDLLADALRANLDMKRIYRILDEGI